MPTSLSTTVRRRNTLIGYSFILPSLTGFFLFTLIPVTGALLLSFMKWDSASPIQFIGLKNFFVMFKNSSFQIALKNTLYYTALTVPLTVIGALFFAVVSDSMRKGNGVFRAIIYFPSIASIVAVSVVWQFMYHPEFGPINSFLKLIGFLNPPRWISSPTWAMPAVIIVSIWSKMGYFMIMFVAGLQTIPNQLYEAAMLDGANTRQKFMKITLPMLSPTMFFVVIICIIGSFKVFGRIYIMTARGPGRSTSVLVYTIYKEAFTGLRFGYASAMALVLFLIILIFTLIQFRYQKKWVNYM